MRRTLLLGVTVIRTAAVAAMPMLAAVLAAVCCLRVAVLGTPMLRVRMASVLVPVRGLVRVRVRVGARVGVRVGSRWSCPCAACSSVASLASAALSAATT